MKRVFTFKKSVVIGIELIVFLVYAVYSIMTYSDVEIAFTADDMELQGAGGNYEQGGYLDLSYTDRKAVVTPKFQLKKGIYYIEASYAEHGNAKAGLIYDRDGTSMVDDSEFLVNPEDTDLFYRVKIRDDSAIRFKLRLTGDATDNDYVQLLQVYIVSSKLTYIGTLFCMAFLFLLLDFVLWGYFKYFKIWSPERKTVFLVLAFTAFFVGMPMYRNGLSEPINMDLVFHLQRMEGLYRGLLSGQFPIRIQPGWLDGYGYASSVFYGDIFLYFPAVLRIVGFTLQDAYKCYCETVNIAAVFVSFYAFRRITKNDIAAMAGSVLYVGSTTNLSLLYTTTMVGNYSALPFYPLVIAGFYLIFTEDVSSKEYKRIWIILAFGFTGLLMTHMISCLILGAYSVICCLFMIKKVFRRNTVLELMKAVCATILLNLWFLLPFMNYMLSEKIRINSELGKELGNSEYYALLGAFLKKGGGRSVYNLFLHPEYHIDYAVLFVLLLYAVTIPIQKKNKLTGCSRVFAAFTVLAFWLCTDLFPIVRMAEIHPVFLKFFTTLQYQYRFFSIAIAIAVCLGAVFFAMEVLDQKSTYIIVGLLCCFILYQDGKYFETVMTESIYLDYIDLEIMNGSYEMGKAEYLPVATDMDRLTRGVEYDEALQIDGIKRTYLTFDIAVANPTGQEKDVLLPVLYYSGYRSFDIESKDALKTAVGDNGRVAVTVPASYNGTFHMAFYEPWQWRAAEMISLLALFFIIYYLIRGKELRGLWKSKM